MPPGDNARVSWLRDQIRMAQELLEGTMAGVTPERAHWAPPGVASPIGANYAHIVFGQDGLVAGLLQAAAPLFAAAWAGRTGASELPPGPEAASPGFPDWSKWARRVRIDLVAFRPYAEAVYGATDRYLASLDDAGLGRSVDVSALGLDRMTVGQLLNAGVLGNTLTHVGEISCLKGLQGAKGYPF